MAVATIPNFRPMRLAELLDLAFRIYRRNFLTFIGILAVVQIPLTLLSIIIAYLTYGGPSFYAALQDFRPETGFSELFGARALGGLGLTLIVSIIGLVLVQGFATAALVRGVGDSYFGQPVTLVEAYKRIGSSWTRLLGAVLLSILLGLCALVWLLVPCIGWLTGPGLLVFFGLVVFQLVVPVVVLEGAGPRRAIRRAWDLARRRFWWLMGFAVLLYLLQQLIVVGPSLLISSILQVVLTQSSGPDIVRQAALNNIIQSFVALFVGLIYLPLQLTAITVVYFDLRMRTEGLDLALQARIPDGELFNSDLVAMIPAAAMDQQLVTGREVGYFFLLSLVPLGLYVGLTGLLFIFFLLAGMGAG